MSSDAFLAVSIPRLGTTSSARLEEQARSRGHAAGYTDGLRAAQVEVDRRMAELEDEHARALRVASDRTAAAVAVLQAAAHALNTRTLPVLAESHGALAAAAIELAEAILGYELGNEERTAHAAVARALDVTHLDDVRTVRLHPADLALLDDHARRNAGVIFTADPSLSRGDAVTEFPSGYLDARLSTALDRAKVALLAENP
jgi:flagellar assembly protein FliH